jgi:hypothetical protein
VEESSEQRGVTKPSRCLVGESEGSQVAESWIEIGPKLAAFDALPVHWRDMSFCSR